MPSKTLKKNIHTYIHANIPEPVFHQLHDFGFAPSALRLRLNCLGTIKSRYDDNLLPTIETKFMGSKYGACDGKIEAYNTYVKTCVAYQYSLRRRIGLPI